jgi:hypothetical protein
VARHGRWYGREEDVGGLGLGQYISSYSCTNEHEHITSITQKDQDKNPDNISPLPHFSTVTLGNGTKQS